MTGLSHVDRGLFVTRLDWMDLAKCAGTLTMAGWHPVMSQGRNDRRYEEKVARCRSYCDGCPVRKDCARFALDCKAVSGVWAGVDVGVSGPDNASKQLRKIAEGEA